MNYEDVFCGGACTPQLMYGFVLQYTGGVLISGPPGDPEYDGGATLTPSETKLPNTLQWSPSSSLFAFGNCTVAYVGATYDQGIVDSDCQTGSAGPGYYCSRCTVTFPCEGDL